MAPGVAHTATRDLLKPFSALVLRLVGLILNSELLSLAPSNHFRTETTSHFHHDNLADRGLNAIFCVFDVTLNLTALQVSLGQL